jgi:hypothetical protein
VTTDTTLFSETCSSCGCSAVYEATGTIVEADDTVELTLPATAATLALQITGTWSGDLLVEGTIDGTTYIDLQLQPLPTGDLQEGIDANGAFQAGVAGYSKVRVVGDTGFSGEAAVTLRATSGGASQISVTAVPPPYTYTRADVTLTGANNDVLLEADTTRKAAIVLNRSGNDDAYYDLSGGVIVDAEALTLFAGGAPAQLSEPDCPLGEILVKGTAGNILSVWIGR